MLSIAFIVLFAVLLSVLTAASAIWLIFKAFKLIIKIIPAVFAVGVLFLIYLFAGSGIIGLIAEGFVFALILGAVILALSLALIGWAAVKVIKRIF